MKRTQLYLEEDIFKTLKRIGKERSVTISELVREALQRIYGQERPDDAASILREAAGIWKDRKDLGSAEEYVRAVRKDTRRGRLGLKS
jgi:predicted DNA-binding ribbon-helix-helix protein